jgi:glycosyltransferase involved in cell wall biosynthesis
VSPDGGAPRRVGIAYQGPSGFGAAWSGIPAGLAGGLRELGVETVTLNVDLPRPLRPVARTWGRAVYRHRLLGPLSPEARAVARTWARRRRRSLPAVDLWIACGRAVSDAPAPDGAPLATFSDMPIGESALANERIAALPGRVLRSLQRRQAESFRHAAACCLASDWAVEAAVAEGGVPREKAHVVGFGRNLEPRPVARDWSEPRFLFVGADWRRKNGDAVVRAFARLRAENAAARLDVVGNHPPLGVEGVVEHGPLRLTDPGDRRRLEGLFEQATSYVMPSRFEAFGMVYVEAGSAGVPSIGTTRGGAATAIGDGGLLVDPDDERALLEAMRELATPERAQELGRAALAHSAPYTWRQVAERILAAVAAAP